VVGEKPIGLSALFWPVITGIRRTKRHLRPDRVPKSIKDTDESRKMDETVRVDNPLLSGHQNNTFDMMADQVIDALISHLKRLFVKVMS
jgi:hypothetical protein